MWGRLATCGRVVLGLVAICILIGRPIEGCPPGAGPQDTILPHIKKDRLPDDESESRPKPSSAIQA
jgi:hypothetical protein